MTFKTGFFVLRYVYIVRLTGVYIDDFGAILFIVFLSTLLRSDSWWIDSIVCEGFEHYWSRSEEFLAFLDCEIVGLKSIAAIKNCFENLFLESYSDL